MRFSHQTMTVAGCALLVATGLTTGTAGASQEVTCPTPEKTSKSVKLGHSGRWAYEYYVSWCVEGGKITAITPHLKHEADGIACVWVASAEESQKPLADGSGGVDAFNMSEFSCKTGDGTDGSINPWGVITVWPDGRSSIRQKGIGDVIVP